jgi:twinkle protein
MGVMSQGPQATDAVIFEYRLRGEVHNAKIRRGKGNMPWAQEGKVLIPWNIDALVQAPHPDEELVITEGEFDAVAVAQVGWTRVISVPNGAPGKAESDGTKRYSYLFAGAGKIHPWIDQFQRIIIATDGDGPGQILRDELAMRLGDERCWWVTWPEGCKDANDVLRKHGPDALRQCLRSPKRFWLDLICAMSDIPDEPDEVGITTGFPMWDDPVADGGIRLPEYGFVTVSGPANIGKSVFVRQLLWNGWRMHGRPFGLTALEEKAKPRYQREFRRLAIGRPMPTWELRDVGHADIEIDRAMKVLMRPRGTLLDVKTLAGTIEYGIKVYGLQTVCIDPVNELEYGELARDQADAIGKLIMLLKDIADNHRALIVCVAHPPIDVVRKKRPQDAWTGYDVEGSRHWAGKSDAGFSLWRPHRNAPSYCNVWKLKTHEIFGKPDVWMLEHDAKLNTYTPKAHGTALLDGIAEALDAGLWDAGPKTPEAPEPPSRHIIVP